MAFKMKGPFNKSGDQGTELTPEQRARLAYINKNINNTGISEKKYQSLRAEQRALSGK